jgi:hypothetical protein
MLPRNLVFAFVVVLASILISSSMAGEFAGDARVAGVSLYGCSIDSPICTTGSDVIEAENQNFQKKVIDTGSLTLVSFYAPWLVHKKFERLRLMAKYER